MAKSSGTANWTRAEIDFLLLLLDRFIPLTTPDWEEIKAQFDKKYANKQRTAAALQRWFTTLDQTKRQLETLTSPLLFSKRRQLKK
jgi:hypothetical protein